ncbi:response regulator transcription factor [Cryptosporangium sp. NPDC051539]|uniref:response regulator transcription factor n=1 Tax=Cryptosporangium sp. NPDC051539 TaxID=3363962 RepID=UPI0037BA9770
MTGLRILVVEDDHALRDVVARALRENDYTVATAVDGSAALATAAAGSFDLAVLDVGLPDSDGRDVCQALRARGFGTPVLFLTARGELSDRLTGFAAGGDDYLTKPFHVAELLARLRALAKRLPDPTPVVASGLRLDPSGHALLSPTGRSELTPTEFRLLGCLLAAPGAVIRRRELRQAGWPDDSYVSDNSVDQSIARLRRKLSAVDTTHTIETVRGVGYRYS